MIETDLARIASALETLADAYCRQVDTTARFLADCGPSNADVDLNPTEPKEFVKPGPGPGRGKKKPRPEVLEENPTQEDTTAQGAEAPDTAQETDTSPASPSEQEAPAAPEAPAIPEVTLEDVSRAVVELAKIKTRDEIVEIWKPFGIKRGSELKPDQYFDALMAIKEAMRA